VFHTSTSLTFLTTQPLNHNEIDFESKFSPTAVSQFKYRRIKIYKFGQEIIETKKMPRICYGGNKRKLKQIKRNVQLSHMRTKCFIF